MQFEAALRLARRVFVLGHSLTDRALGDALQRNVLPPERQAVSLLADPEPTPASRGHCRIDLRTAVA